MNVNYELDFYMAVGEHHLAADAYRDLLDVFICQSHPRETRDQYSMFVFNQRGLDKILYNPRGDFQRFFIVFRETNTDNLVHFLEWILERCKNKGNIYLEFEKYAMMSLEDLYWSPDGTWSPLTVRNVYLDNIPTLQWQFDRGSIPTPDELIFDERITIDISWSCNGNIMTFRGYWYAISTAFLSAQTQKYDPYYRRFAFICHTFDLERFQECVDEFLDTFSRRMPEKRELFLRHHFETDDDPNLYNK